jgi:outer membrane protein OmpA-like peptidoglycan-associated protein
MTALVFGGTLLARFQWGFVMTRYRFLALLLATSLLGTWTAPALLHAQANDADAKDCKDHALLTRMQNMRIVSCKTTEFDQFAFKTVSGPQTVEGKRVEIRYTIKAGGTAPSPLAIIRNHQDAVARIGGNGRFEDRRFATLAVTSAGKEVWVQVDTAWGGGYMLTIVEKKAMVQEVVASAEMFKTGLGTSGHVEVPGIFFDTGKAELKPESNAALSEIAALLKADPALKVFVVGHTDNVATLDVNTRLSQSRADAVVQALTAQHGIAAARMTARGVGPLAPVVSNDSEDGRARNRRVELVKQ